MREICCVGKKKSSIVFQEDHLQMSHRTDIVPRNSHTAEIDASVKNKWRWDWLDREHDGDFTATKLLPGKITAICHGYAHLNTETVRMSVSYDFEPVLLTVVGVALFIISIDLPAIIPKPTPFSFGVSAALHQKR